MWVTVRDTESKQTFTRFFEDEQAMNAWFKAHRNEKLVRD